MSVPNDTIVTMNTPIEDRIIILTDLANEVEAGQHPELEEWVAWHNISMPIATLISMGIFQINPVAQTHINNTFNKLLDYLEIEDLGYKRVADLLG